MGVIDTVVLEEDVALPKFPEGRTPNEIDWQSKDVARPSMLTFKLTASGRLLRREREMCEKTDEEKRSEADEHGFDAWSEYVSFCEEADPEELMERGMRFSVPNEETVAEEFWVDHNMHGSFEFHGSHDDIEDGFYWSYEARFTRGDLDALVFLGERNGGDRGEFRPEESDIVRF
jgi:hypothetical protein